METKLITKTIKELADEYDGNVEQLHRTISGYSKLTDDQKKEIESLRLCIKLKQCEIARAEKTSEATIFIAFSSVAVLFVWIAMNILIG